MNANSGFFVDQFRHSLHHNENNAGYYSHLGREVRAIRDLLITCLSIKEASENITNNLQASLYLFDLNLDLCIHHYFVRVLFLLL